MYAMYATSVVSCQVIGLQIVSMSTSGIQLSWLGVPSDLSGGVRSLEILFLFRVHVHAA